MFRKIRIQYCELGLVFEDGRLVRVLEEGKHRLKSKWGCERKVTIVNLRETRFEHENLEAILQSDLLKDQLEVLDLEDRERALVWIDRRFAELLGPGLHVYWKSPRQLKTEKLTVEDPQFKHAALEVIAKASNSYVNLDEFQVHDHHLGLLYFNGEFLRTLSPNMYYFWKGLGKVKLYHIDMREKVKDITGQEIMTKDKVTLRVNATLSYRISDALKSVEVVSDVDQSLYREAQFVLRSALGGRKLDELLSDKEELFKDLNEGLAQKTIEYGVELSSLGIKDIILPGEMKDLLNKVTEAQKAAEANLIFRREEVAAMRSQSNTAKMLDDSPALMRLKELEVLEKIASNSKLNLVLGEKGLSERMMNML